jgi:hypothetical protein
LDYFELIYVIFEAAVLGTFTTSKSNSDEFSIILGKVAGGKDYLLICFSIVVVELTISFLSLYRLISFLFLLKLLILCLLELCGLSSGVILRLAIEDS